MWSIPSKRPPVEPEAAPEPDGDLHEEAQEEPQVDKPTDPGVVLEGPSPGQGSAKSPPLVPPAPAGLPVSYGPGGDTGHASAKRQPLASSSPAGAPLASGGVDEEDVVPGDLMPELDYPFHQVQTLRRNHLVQGSLRDCQRSRMGSQTTTSRWFTWATTRH